MNPPADIVLGAMYFGTKADEKSSFDLLDRFVELGGPTIDTANCYAFWADPSGAGGQSEEVIGRWLRANPKDHRFGFVTDETIDYLTEHPDMELWAYAPLVQGSYDRDDRPFPDAYEHPGNTARLEVLTTVAEELGVARGQVVLAWLLQNRLSIRPIAGVTTPAQLEQAMAAAHLDLAPHLARLNEPG